MKKLFLTLVALAALSLAGRADVLQTNLASAGIHILLASPKVINSITLVASNAPTAILAYDNSAAASTYTNAAYTNFTTFSSNVVTTYVTTTGVTNNLTNAVLYTAANAVAANTNALPVLASLAAGPNGSTVFGAYPIALTKGLAISNNAAGCTVQIVYRDP